MTTNTEQQPEETGNNFKNSFVQSAYDLYNKHLEKGFVNIPITKDLYLVKNNYYLIGGNAGTGKTSYCDSFFVFKACNYADKHNIPLKIIYLSYERSVEYKIIKWVCMYAKQEFDITLSVFDVLNINKSDKNKTHKKEIKECFRHINKLIENHIILVNNKLLPTQINEYIQRYYNNIGKIHRSTNNFSMEEKVQYVPENPDLITTLVIDHIGKVPKEKNNDKANVDIISSIVSHNRDLYGLSPVVISQFNRGLGDFNRKKLEELRPQESDFKNSGNTFED